MSRRTRPSLRRSSRLAPLLCLAGLCLATAWAEDDKPQPAVEVYDWSVWVSSPAQVSLNGPRVYKNAMPGVVGTSRPKLEGKELAGKFPVAPISVVQFFGEPSRDLDIDLRVKKGLVLAHWPPATERAGRVQWFKSDLTKAPAAGVPVGFLPESHWLTRLRKIETALYAQREQRAERFLAYDTEVAVAIPLKLRGGPDEYTLQNLTEYRLLDVAVIVPTDKGYRVGWLDELPSGTPEGKDESSVRKAKEKAELEKKKKSTREKAEEVFEKGEADAKKEKDKDKEDEPKPLPAEGDANVKASVDQILNRPITVNVEQAPRKEMLDLVTRQARLRYELDEKTLAKDMVDLGKTMSLKAVNIAARDALAEVLGTVGLSYRVTETGSLFVTTPPASPRTPARRGP